ncbi:MAG: 23S rRNA (guanosine(2251)-2'-O)-methyltransferase RlmB [Mycoplasmatales bacterium]|nr:23S rRNA (guanosine(2251)-2'-O)-methyltransferase RlmB [Mycoplasmatales bacterium]
MAEFICGKNSVLEAVKNKVKIKRIFVTKNVRGEFGNIDVIVKTSHELDRMVKANHQGYVAEIQEFNYYNIKEILKDKPKKILVLDHIQDPHNFGAIIRSANASGVKHIIIPKDRAVKVTPVVLKVSSGGAVNMKIIRVDSLFSSVKFLKNNQYWIYTTELDESAIPVEKASFNYPLVLIVGNEQKGVNKSLSKIADQKLYIKMRGTVQSLNVSVATGIMLFKI